LSRSPNWPGGREQKRDLPGRFSGTEHLRLLQFGGTDGGQGRTHAAIKPVAVWIPIKVRLSDAIEVAMEFQIIVDAKHHRKPIDIGSVGRIRDLCDDVGAHAAIIMAPNGFAKGAEERAKEARIILRSVTSDLLAMLQCVGRIGILLSSAAASDPCPPGVRQRCWNELSGREKAIRTNRLKLLFAFSVKDEMINF
jgi:hypothetical protein